MQKFVIQRIEGNDTTNLAMFDDKETALREGEMIFDSIREKCTIVCVKAEVDEQGQVLGSRVWLYKVWRQLAMSVQICTS